MTAVQLTTVVLNDAADPSDYRVLSCLTKWTRTPKTDGRIQRVAGGAFRLITLPGVAETWQLTLRKASLDLTAWIEDHAARPLCVRDDSGLKLFAAYLEPRITPVARPRSNDVELELTSLTWTEAV